MPALEHLPFGLGETLSGKDTDNNLINKHWLGLIYDHPLAPATATDNRGNKARLSGRTIRAVILRNESGQTLYGKRVARLTATAGYSLVTSVDGYAGAGLANANVIIIDDKLATTGVADDDLFWGVISGPQVVLTAMAGADFNGDIAVGGFLVASTGTTTGATTSGRVSNITFTAATAGNTSNGLDGFKMANNMVGVALSARTTGETHADLLIDARLNFR